MHQFDAFLYSNGQSSLIPLYLEFIFQTPASPWTLYLVVALQQSLFPRHLLDLVHKMSSKMVSAR